MTPCPLSGHSARRSEAKELARRGWPIDLIAKLGRWGSSAIHSYVEEAASELPCALSNVVVHAIAHSDNLYAKSAEAARSASMDDGPTARAKSVEAIRSANMAPELSLDKLSFLETYFALKTNAVQRTSTGHTRL